MEVASLVMTEYLYDQAKETGTKVFSPKKKPNNGSCI